MKNKRKNRFSPDDLNQISIDSLNRLNKSDLVSLTLRLRDFGIELYENLNQDSSNSSRPPSSDDPFKKKDKADSSKESKTEDQEDGDQPVEDRNAPRASDDSQKRSAGRQPDSQGFWRAQKPKAEMPT